MPSNLCGAQPLTEDPSSLPSSHPQEIRIRERDSTSYLDVLRIRQDSGIGSPLEEWPCDKRFLVLDTATCEKMVSTPVVALPAPEDEIVNCEYLRDPSRPSTRYERAAVNQGTAVKIKKVSDIKYAYPSDRPRATPVWNIFYVQPRNIVRGRLPLSILERHPYTSQTFVPLGASSTAFEYVVVVAEDKNGKPNLSSLLCRLCRGNQAGTLHREGHPITDAAVTYGMNQWHAPMISLREPMRFAVTNAENGTTDDLEEFEFAAQDVILELAQPSL